MAIIGSGSKSSLLIIATVLGALLAPGICPAQEGGNILTIDQALELAKKNNPTLQVTAEKLFQAELLIDKAWVMVKPQLNAYGTFTHTEPDAALDFPDFESISFDPVVCQGEPLCFQRFVRTEIIKQNSFAINASLNQPLFLAQAYTAIKSARSGYDLAKVNSDNLEEFLLHSVEVAYYGAMTAQKFLDSAEKAVDLRKEHLRVAQAKFEVGDQPKLTVLRAEIDVNQAEQDVKQAENSLALAKEAIGLLIGRYPDFVLAEPAPTARPTRSQSDFIQNALSERRDLVAARLNLELAERSKQDAWFRFLPVLALTGNFRASDTKGFTGEYYTWNVGLALSIPLYDGGLRYTLLDEAESKIREAQIGIREKEATIRSEIRQLWIKLESAESNLEKARRSLDLAQEQFQLSKISFEAGAITNLEVLDANHLLFVTEIAVAQLELSLQLAIMQLEKAVRMYNPAGAAASTGGQPMGGGTSGGAAQQTGSSAGSGAAGGGGAPAGLGL